MSNNRFHIEISVPVTSDSYVENVKTWINTILDAAPTVFTFSEVVTDTSSTYGARLQIYDSPLYLYVYNSTNSIYFGVQALSNGAYIEMVAGQRCRYSVDYTYPAHTLYLSVVDNCLVTLVAHNVTSNHYAVIVYGMAFSEYLDTNLYMCNGTNSSTTTPEQLLTCLPTFNNTPVTFREDTQAKHTFNLLWPGDLSSYIVNGTGNAYSLVPIACAANCTETNGRAWSGRLLWGGRYTLYRVNSGSSAYVSSPSTTYNIDGAEYVGCFTNIIIPLETS